MVRFLNTQIKGFVSEEGNKGAIPLVAKGNNNLKHVDLRKQNLEKIKQQQKVTSRNIGFGSPYKSRLIKRKKKLKKPITQHILK